MIYLDFKYVPVPRKIISAITTKVSSKSLIIAIILINNSIIVTVCLETLITIFLEYRVIVN